MENSGTEQIVALLRTAVTDYSHRSAVDALIEAGVPAAVATQQLLEALSSGVVLEHGDEQIYLHPSQRRGW